MMPRQDSSILCADDEPAILSFVKRVLATGGYSVVTAADGFAALTKLNANPQRFQIVLTDLRMPRLDGFALIERARAGGYTGEFIVIAGSLSLDDRLRLGDLRVSAIIEKPVRPGALLDAVRLTHIA